jgi:hypothetical protein
MFYTQANFAQVLQTFWDKTLVEYKRGSRSPEEFFNEEDLLYMTQVGVTPHDVYDHVEDFLAYKEPDFFTFLLVMAVRREYFLYIQEGQVRMDWVIDTDLPLKTDSYENIVWLPRITAKAYAKIQGELHPTLMYGCAGDRRFLQGYKLHAADFLSMVGRLDGNLAKVHKWLLSLDGHPCF